MIQPKIIFSEAYDISFMGIERLHPFDSAKYSRAFNLLAKEFPGTLMQRVGVPRFSVDNQLLELVHTPDYLASLKNSENVQDYS